MIIADCPPLAGLVGLPGLEPGTSSLSVTRSNQLSYSPPYTTEPFRNRGIVPKIASSTQT